MITRQTKKELLFEDRLNRPQISDKLDIGLLTLNKWIRQGGGMEIIDFFNQHLREKHNDIADIVAPHMSSYLKKRASVYSRDPYAPTSPKGTIPRLP